MPEQDYSNREITTMFAHIKEQLTDIKAQTTKTNGRVSKLETEQAGMVAKIGLFATFMATVFGVIVQKVLGNL